jgi:2-succinyl-6-hydroxy-2,4-cyclohexadiene-1-carboxylate synthase
MKMFSHTKKWKKSSAMPSLANLIFLHGFLGSSEDFSPLIAQLESDFYCCAPDLTTPTALIDALRKLQPLPTFLIGYSMGGRVALHLAAQAKMCRLILLSTNPGLTSTKEVAARKEEDLKWAELLETLPLEKFLDLWYAQPLFASLKKKKELFEPLLQRRLSIDSKGHANLLRRFGLGTQISSLLPAEATFMYGEEDLKYSNLSHTLPPNWKKIKIAGSGHAVHLENPEACAHHIQELAWRK